MERNVQAGDVVLVTVRFGSQTKTRPAIIVESKGDRSYMLLGSTKTLVPDKVTVVVDTPEHMRTMGLRQQTRFGFGNEADQWLAHCNIIRTIGSLPLEVAHKLGRAWANARFVRAE